MRKLATIETISEVLPHNNADLLELVKVRGWQVVIRKGEFKQGDLVVFCEIYRDWETDRKSTRLNSSHSAKSRMPSSA